MGFLTLNDEVNQLKKAVISIWFRVPSDSAAAARAIAIEDPLSRVLHGVIPLITWGEQPIAHNGTLVPVYQGAVEAGGVPITTQSIGPGPDPPMNPSYIGVFVGTEEFPLDPQLDVHIQTQDFATGSGVSFLVTSWTGTNSGLTYHNPGNPYDGAPIYTGVVYYTTDITSDEFARAPDSFGNMGDNLTLTFDKWHHLLISWDLDNRKMWCALDDENRTGRGLPANSDPFYGMGPNDQLSSNEFGSIGNVGESVSLLVTTLPTNPVNVPGPVKVNYLSPDGEPTSKVPVQHVEMAELQIFTDITLNTGDTSNRRAFVDKDGKPVPANQKQTKDADGNIMEDSGSIELLGKEPEITLHGSGNWKKGNNIGTLGKDKKTGEKLPSGQFKPTGTIKKYTPEPQLGI